MKITVTVKLKDYVEDAEGESVLKALKLLGYNNVKSVRTAKSYYIEIDGNDISEGYEFCDRLLANPVINDCKVEKNE